MLQSGQRPVDLESMSDDADLTAAYTAYRAAAAAWRTQAQRGEGPAADAAAEVLLQARVALYRCLRGTGWVPPHAVEVQLDRDAALVEAPAEFDALLGT